MKTPRILKENLLFQYLYSIYSSNILRHKYKSLSSESIPSPTSKMIVFMVNGIIHHGGLCDRLHGLISTFQFCKEMGYQFKVCWNYPFKLDLFLQPNSFDWLLKDDEITYDCKNVTPVYFGTIHDTNKQFRLAKIISRVKTPIVHVYTNMHYKRENISSIFKYLFSESDILQKELQIHRRELNHDYVSITFRFQQLLNDFKEGEFPVLASKERDCLINVCLSQIRKIREKYPNERILLTSDSVTFLERAANEFPFIYTIPGNLVHMDYVKNESDPIKHLKPFVDLLMISSAKKVFFVRTDRTYPSSFAKTGALIGESPYEEIIIHS